MQTSKIKNILRIRSRYLMWKMGLRSTIPAEIINNIPIKENNDPLINIKEDTSFFFSSELQKKEEILLRSKTYNKLKSAQNFLPANTYFKIFSTFRSSEEQLKRWQELYRKNQEKNPNFDVSELNLLTKGQIADPRSGFGGHQTGGAIDITLCDQNGKEFDMGTKIGEHGPQTKTKTKNLTDEQKQNRRILTSAMQKAGLQNYPGEWWHYSYGDRLWSAYNKQKCSNYGFINQR